jgi:hypothetical protein
MQINVKIIGIEGQIDASPSESSFQGKIDLVE